MNLIQQIEAEEIGKVEKDIPDFRAGDTVRFLEGVETPNGIYVEIPATILPGQDEVIDGVTYQSFDAVLNNGLAGARFFGVRVRLAGG